MFFVNPVSKYLMTKGSLHCISDHGLLKCKRKKKHCYELPCSCVSFFSWPLYKIFILGTATCKHEHVRAWPSCEDDWRSSTGRSGISCKQMLRWESAMPALELQKIVLPTLKSWQCFRKYTHTDKYIHFVHS